MAGEVGDVNGAAPGLARAKLGTRVQTYATMLREVHDDHTSLVPIIRNQAVNAAGLAIGTGSKTKVKVVNKLAYFNAGTLKVLAAATEVAFTPTTDDVTANGGAARERWYLVWINAAGTAGITVGGASAAVGSATLPSTPAGATPIGLVRIEVAAGATDFDATTDELDEAHITDEYYDLTAPYAGDMFPVLTASKPDVFPNT